MVEARVVAQAHRARAHRDAVAITVALAGGLYAAAPAATRTMRTSGGVTSVARKV
jgi:hypothetical protein